jgi:phosphoribosyl 1,2-cyclic phosphodiesterase
MRVWVLGSGSRGNAVLVESAGTRVLVDAGFAPRTLAARLAAIGFTPADVHGVLVTHEHLDHAKGAAAAARHWGWSVHASRGTIGALPELADVSTAFAPGATVALGALTCETVRVPHDAAAPVAVVVGDPVSGARCGVAMDLGAVPAALLAAFKGLDVLVLEANHDAAMLADGPYPASVQARIASKTGHLSNDQAAQAARSLAGRTVRHLVLAHLSDRCNTPALAIDTVRRAVEGTRFKGQVHAAPADAPIGPFAPVATRVQVPSQLELELAG